MNVIKKFTIKSLKNNKKWTLVTIIGIIISTAMITAVFTLTASFIDLMQKATIEDRGNWHVALFDLKIENIKTIEQNKLTSDYMLRRKVGYAQLEKYQNSDKPYVFVEQYDDKAMKYFPLHLISGRLPQNNREIIISKHIETDGGVKYNIGDKIKLSIGDRVLPNGQELMQNEYYHSSQNEDEENTEVFVPKSTIEYTVVGIIVRPEFESRWAPGYTVITYLDKKAFMPDDSIDIYMLSSKLDKNLEQNVLEMAQELGTDQSNVAFNTDLLRYLGVIGDDDTRQIIFIFALVMVFIIMIASVSLIYNAFAISVSERIKQLGMLASVGATKRQKRENVYFEGFIVGLIGIPLGIISGIVGIGITIKAVSPLLRDTMNVDFVELQMVVSPSAILITTLFAMLTIFISVYIPARRASRIMPIDAIRQSEEVKMTSKNIRTSKLTKVIFGFEGELAMKNLKRSRKKYMATILSLTISIVLFLTVATVSEYTRKSTEIQLTTEKINFDASVRLSSSSEEIRNKIFNSIISLDLVDDNAIVREFSGKTYVSEEYIPEIGNQVNLYEENGKYFYRTALISIGDEAFEKYVASIGGNIEDFNDPTKPRAILVNRAVTYLPEESKYVESEAIKIQKGDNIPFAYPTDSKIGANSTRNIEWGISYITDELPIGTITNSFGQLQIVTSDEIFDSIVNSQNINDVNVMLAIKTSDGEKLDEQIKQIFKENEINDSYMYNSSINAKNSKRISIVMGVFIYGFITLISLICIANIFNTVSTNIALRRKEFAMLRSVGMEPKSFNKMMNFESVFYGIKALMYGLPISVVISIFLYKTLQQSISFAFTLPWRDYAIAIIFVFIIVAATMAYSGGKIRKQNIIDALKDDSY